MLPIRPKFEAPLSLMDGVVRVPQMHADPAQLYASAPQASNTRAFLKLVAQPSGERKFGSGQSMPTLNEQHQAKVAAVPSARLVLANTDINGRFVDGSGQVEVGMAHFDEFPVLRVLGHKVSEGISDALTYGVGLLDWFNPTGAQLTPQARYAMDKTEAAVISATGLMADMLTHPFQTVSDSGLAMRRDLDEANELSKQGQDASAATLRADVAWQLMSLGLGTTRAVSFVKAKPEVLRVDLPRPRIDLSDKIFLKKKSAGGRVREYEYKISGQHFLQAKIENGILSNYVWVEPGLRSNHGGGRDMLLSLMLRLQKDGVPVKAIRQEWLRGMGDNHRDYVLNKQVRRMSSEQAAAKTWSGEFWSGLGYKKIRVEKENDYGAMLIFE